MTKKVRIPEDFDMKGIKDLTKGKEYEVYDTYWIKDDVGEPLLIIMDDEGFRFNCSHLRDEAQWEVVS